MRNIGCAYLQICLDKVLLRRFKRWKALLFGGSEYLLTFAVSKTKRIFSSVGLEHYLDRVGVGAQQILVLFVKVRVLMRQL